jgi:phage replication initiation protein
MKALMKTTVDWLKFRTKANPFETLDALISAFGTVGELLSFGEPAKGKDGWHHRRAVILAGDMTIAQIDYGGESQRGWLRFDMSGAGCEWVQDWGAMAKALESIQAQLRRVDLALTTHDGSVTHDMVVKAHQDGMFCNGGRNPKRRDITGSDPRDGRTVYVGVRDGAKYVRCYEKGFEVLNKLGVPEGLKSTCTHIQYNGVGQVKVEDLYRVEVEFKDVDKVLPFTMLTDRDSYFAGANAFCASLLPGASERRVMGLPDFNAKAMLAVQLEHCRRAYGAIIRTAILVHGDERAVLAMIAGDEPSDRLIASGVLSIAV